MKEVSPELQKKINRLMRLKYKSHKKVMGRTWFFIIAYTVVLFFYLLSRLDFKLPNNYFIHLFVFFFLEFIFLEIIKASDRTKLITSFVFFYYLFYSVFLLPLLVHFISDLPIIGKILRILIALPPVMMVIFRISIADFLGSDKLIRKVLKKKDVDVWSCPQCHDYILKKPIRFCPHCGYDKYSPSVLGVKHVFCKKCGFTLKIRDFDFPRFCPHCGLAFNKHKFLNKST